MQSEPKRPRRLGLFGGTFDPIHSAHLEVAAAATRSFLLDEVLFVPAGIPPHKTTEDVTSYRDRLRMVELACAPYPKFYPSRLEESDERSYSINTVNKLRQKLNDEDQLFFLIGADAFSELTTWKSWHELVAKTDFIVISRPGHLYLTPEGATVHRLDGLALPVSSSEIRERLLAGADTPELPPSVRDYIDTHALYSVGSRQTSDR